MTTITKYLHFGVLNNVSKLEFCISEIILEQLTNSLNNHRKRK